MKTFVCLLFLLTSYAGVSADEVIMLGDARLRTWPTVNGQYTMHHFEITLTGPETYYFPMGLTPNLPYPPDVMWKRKLGIRSAKIYTDWGPNTALFKAGWHSDVGYFMVGLRASEGTHTYHFAVFERSVP